MVEKNIDEMRSSAQSEPVDHADIPEPETEQDAPTVVDKQAGGAADRPTENQDASKSDPQACLQAELAASQAKAADYGEQLLRAQAELENLRRRSERQVANAHKFSLEKFAKTLLPVVDSLEMALQTPKTVELEKFFSGIELTHKMLLDALAKQGIKQLNPMAEKFNPQLHEAMSTQVDAEAEPNTILVVMQKGYVLYDRLIRPALVVVSTT